MCHYDDNWMCDLDSDVAESSKDTQRIEPKPKTQLSSKVRPVCGQESTKRCVLTPKHVEEDQTGTVKPVLDQKEEHEIDFRVPGLSHSVVKEAEHLRVQELVKRMARRMESPRQVLNWSTWQKPPVRRKGGRAGMPRMGKWPPRGTGTTVLTYPGSAPR